MIFAHCHYSLKVGEETAIDFNWKCLERQVVDRFIRGRPRLRPLVNKRFRTKLTPADSFRSEKAEAAKVLNDSKTNGFTCKVIFLKKIVRRICVNQIFIKVTKVTIF